LTQRDVKVYQFCLLATLPFIISSGSHLCFCRNRSFSRRESVQMVNPGKGPKLREAFERAAS